jgi:hypothetical protein
MMRGTILYFETYRRALNQESPFHRYDGRPRRALTDRQLAHRRRMLEHLRRCNSRGRRVG